MNAKEQKTLIDLHIGEALHVIGHDQGNEVATLPDMTLDVVNQAILRKAAAVDMREKSLQDMVIDLRSGVGMKGIRKEEEASATSVIRRVILRENVQREALRGEAGTRQEIMGGEKDQVVTTDGLGRMEERMETGD